MAGATRVLAALGMTPRVLKTALAAGLSWELAILAGGGQHPYFAPLAAVLALDATVRSSLTRGLERVLGVATGILLAMALASVLAVTAFGVGLLVLAATALATRLRYGPSALTQVAISALLVRTVGLNVPGYALDRAADTLIGAAVAVILNAVVVPPDPTPRARDAMARLGRELAELMAQLGEGGSRARRRERLERARSVDRELALARARVEAARAALALSPLVRWREREVRRYLTGIATLTRAVAHVRGSARALARVVDARPAAPASALAAGERALLAWTDWILAPTARRRVRLARAVLALRREVHGALAQPGPRDPRALSARLAVVVDLEELAEDLGLAARRVADRPGRAAVRPRRG